MKHPADGGVGSTLKASVRHVVRSAIASRWVWSAWSALRTPGVIVLMYHRIAPGVEGPKGLDVSRFRSHMEWLRERCTPIGPEELRSCIARPPRRRPAVLVTFDDGYRDYAELAYPVLADLGIPALVFLATAYIDDPWRLFWWDKLSQGLAVVGPMDVELPWQPGKRVPVRSGDDRGDLLRLVKRHLKQLPNAAREELVGHLLDRLGVPDTALRTTRPMMTWDDVRAVSGLTRWGGHTATHPILSQIDEAQIEVEVRTCRERISEETGEAPRYFAYPNGRAGDFDERARAALRRHGFDLAFCTVEGMNGRDTDWLAIRRFSAVGECRDLAWHASGLATG